MRVYDEPMRFWAEYIADFDLLKADEMQEKYTDYEILRAGLSKRRYG